MCSSRKDPYPTQGRLLKILRGCGVSTWNAQKSGVFKPKNSFCGKGVEYFLEQHNTLVGLCMYINGRHCPGKPPPPPPPPPPEQKNIAVVNILWSIIEMLILLLIILLLQPCLSVINQYTQSSRCFLQRKPHQFRWRTMCDGIVQEVPTWFLV